MGEMQVPENAYYGASTARALENFPLSPRRFPRGFVRALGLIKLAAARVNRQLGLLEVNIADAIEAAALEVADGKLDADFVVDVFQTGSGTSTNMNANEVIASRALEILGAHRGERQRIHPNDHVNLGQSTNDAFPTAMHMAAMEAIEKKVLPALRELAEALQSKADEFKDVVKSARTHLQDAVPMTLGQEFSGYASVVRHGLVRLEGTRADLSELAIGGTAVGTGLNTHREFAPRMIAELRRLTGLLFRRAENPFEAMQNRDAAVAVSSAVRGLAVGLMKIANDLRLLASGPRTGLNEIELPATQPGSSIMPGKVNPVVPEAINMVAAQLIGNDSAIAIAAMNGNLDLNVMMPLIAYDLLESLDLLANAARVFASKCIIGIRANEDVCRSYAEASVSLVTALAPIVGYDQAAAICKTAITENKPIRQALLESGLVTRETIAEILNLEKLAGIEKG